MAESILVIGGGLSGLSASYKLVEKGYDVTVVEASDSVGGMARSFKHAGKWIPITYHHVMTLDFKTQEYIKKFGLWNEMRWKNVDIAFWFNGKGYPLIKPLDILGFKPFGLKDKIRLAKFGLYCRLKKDWNDLKDMKCDEWLNNTIGKNATDVLFRDLADIKFGTDLSSVSASWLGNRLHESVKTGNKYGYINTGLHEMIDRIYSSIVKNGGKILTSTRVTKIRGKKVEMIRNGRKVVFEADKIISTIPPEVLASISDFPDEVKNRLCQIKFKPVICMVCGSKRKLTEYYWNVFIKPRFSFGGIFNYTILDPERGNDGEYIYYVFTYLDEKNPFFALGEDEIKKRYMKDLRKIDSGFKFNWTKIFKIRYSNPLFLKDYKNMPIKILDGIYLAGIYKEFPNTRTMNSALSSGEKTADFIINEYVE